MQEDQVVFSLFFSENSPAPDPESFSNPDRESDRDDLESLFCQLRNEPSIFCPYDAAERNLLLPARARHLCERWGIKTGFIERTRSCEVRLFLHRSEYCGSIAHQIGELLLLCDRCALIPSDDPDSVILSLRLDFPFSATRFPSDSRPV